MKKLGFTKRIIAGALMLTMACGSLAGCGNKKEESPAEAFDGVASETKAMVIGEYDVYLDELLVYAFQNLYLRGETVDGYSDQIDDAVKEEVLSSIRECKILYDVALYNEYSLDDADMVTVDQTSSNFINTFGEELLEEYGVSAEVVKQVFAEQALVAKFETEIKNDMGQTITDDLMEDYKDFSFHSIYYMVFPTVAQDENGEPIVDENGAYTELTASEKDVAKANAEAAIEEMRGGADYLEIAEKYGITNSCTQSQGYIGAYSDDINTALTDLKTDECTDIIDSSLGYVVIYMISADDQTIKENYVYYLAGDYTEGEYETLRLNWLNTIEIHPDGDMEGTVWADYPLVNIVDEIEQKREAAQSQAQ